MTRQRTIEIIIILMRNNMVLFLFFFIALFVSTKVISLIDTRYVEKGESLHPGFMVAVFNQPGGSFSLFTLSKINRTQNDNNYHFLPGQQHDSYETPEGVTSSYDVIEANDNEQIIQTMHKDDDNTVWSTYSVNQNNVISPIKSRMLYFGYVFTSIPIAFVFILVIYLLSFLIQFLVKKFAKYQT